MEHVALGTDEAGRGCIAGSLVVGACAFYPRPPTLLRAAIKVLSDSKSLKKEQRERLYDATLGYHSGVITSYAVYPAVLVDHLNILQASLIGMATSCSMVIEEYPDTTCLFQVKADGNKVPPIYDYCAETDIAGVEAVVKGDVHVPECAVASYVAKVQHDRIFQKVTNDAHALSEHMGWKTNQG